MTEGPPSEPLGIRENHPDDMLLAAFADGNLEPEQRQEVESHLVDCDVCLGTVTMLATISEQEVPEGRSEELERRASGSTGSWPSPGRLSKNWAAAAVVFVLLGVGLIWTSRDERGQAGDRSEGAPSETRILRGPVPRTAGPTVVAPRAGQVLAPGEIEVRWSAVAGAIDYTVLLVTADGDPVWRQKVAQTSLKIPTSVPLQPGEIYFVSVRAHLLEARTLDSSHVEFQIGPRD